MDIYNCDAIERKSNSKVNTDFISKNFKLVQGVNEKKNNRKYPKIQDIVDFDFKDGGEIALGKKDKKLPTSGKIKMKSYNDGVGGY